MNKLKQKIKTYVKVPETILASSKLNPSQKLIVSYVLRWQSSGKVCFESNSSLARKFGMSLSGIKKQITQLNKLPFFVSEETSDFNEFGKWSNSKKMTVDNDSLDLYLATPKEKNILHTIDEIEEAEAEAEADDSPIDAYEAFSDLAKTITNNTISEALIKTKFDFMKEADVPRTMKNINHLLAPYATPASLSPPGLAK